MHKLWLYYPFIEDCRTVPGTVTTEFQFDIREGKPVVTLLVESHWDIAKKKGFNLEPKPSVYIQKPAIPYPSAAQSRGQSGFALLRFERDSSNRALSPEIVAGYPPKVFDNTVLRWIKGAELRPLADDGTEDKVTCQLLVFQLVDG
ncbi:energy transducer TonB [Chitinimonas sp.]|uniref:energy transducer TonB n=1 Tax=Chitinimonas sp. TaxID=1934313 RepID=UPI002F94925B